MSNNCMDMQFANIIDLLDDNKSNIKTADYVKIMESLKDIFNKKKNEKVVIKKFCTNCLTSCSDSECSSDSDNDY